MPDLPVVQCAQQHAHRSETEGNGGDLADLEGRIMTLESLLEGLDHQRPGTSSASRDCRTLKTINDHPGPCHESSFVIARIWHVSGGKTGGTIRLF